MSAVSEGGEVWSQGDIVNGWTKKRGDEGGKAREHGKYSEKRERESKGARAREQGQARASERARERGRERMTERENEKEREKLP